MGGFIIQEMINVGKGKQADDESVKLFRFYGKSLLASCEKSRLESNCGGFVGGLDG